MKPRILPLLLLSGWAAPATYADWCAGASHIACYPGPDDSGRSPQALYQAAEEGLREAATPAQRAMARQAMQDAYNPAMRNLQAEACYDQGKSYTANGSCIDIPQRLASGSGPEIALPQAGQHDFLDAIATALGLSIGAVFLVLASLYFVPSILSAARGGSATPIVLLVNIFLGWTFLGWLAALMIALLAPTKIQSQLQKEQLRSARRARGG